LYENEYGGNSELEKTNGKFVTRTYIMNFVLYGRLEEMRRLNIPLHHPSRPSSRHPNIITGRVQVQLSVLRQALLAILTDAFPQSLSVKISE
jgi:hypothetical protein